MSFFKRLLFKFTKKKLNIGIGTYGINYDSIKSFKKDDQIVIGSYSSIAENVTFLLSGEHNYKHISTYPFHDRFDLKKNIYRDTFDKGKLVVKNDVWIGYGVTILSGVTVGDGAVIGAGAIVTKDVPPYAIVAGNPAKIIKYRFKSAEIEELLKIKWWNWSEEVIKKRRGDFYLQISDFIDKYNVQGNPPKN